MYEDIAKALELRLAELSGHIAEIDQELRSALPADWEEQATQLEGQDALEGIEKQKLKEVQQNSLGAATHRGRPVRHLREMRGGHRPQAAEGAAHRDFLPVLRRVSFALTFQKNPPREQWRAGPERRSQGRL